MTPITFSNKIISWYRKHGRHDLPWQKNKTPYRVWVSEIMLQQTQVSTVIPYYQKFMVSFTCLKALANASQDNVLSHWSGLGYYARARNMHKAAQIIQTKHSGRFPATLDEIIKLPGVGLSTAGAILSFAHDIPASILDGNVKRVLCRFFAIEGWPGKPAVINQLWEIAKTYTPKRDIAEYNQAMMDLGATLCSRSKPNCPACPLKSNCQAFKAGIPSQFPYPKPKKNYPIKHTQLLVIQNSQGQVLLEKRPPIGIWGGLWCFPECSVHERIDNYCQKIYGYKVNVVSKKEYSISHKFSHFQLNINVKYLHVLKPIKSKVMETALLNWYTPGSNLPGGVAVPTTKVLQTLSSYKQPKITWESTT